MHFADTPEPSALCPNCGCTVRPTDEKCPDCGVEFVTDESTKWSISNLPEMRYQNAYVWLILVSALDVMLTLLAVVIWPGGYEVNPIAAAVLEVRGFGWTIVFKFATILLVIVLCEVIGRRSDRAGRRLSQFAVGLNALTVMYTLFLLFRSPIGG